MGLEGVYGNACQPAIQGVSCSPHSTEKHFGSPVSPESLKLYWVTDSEFRSCVSVVVPTEINCPDVSRICLTSLTSPLCGLGLGTELQRETGGRDPEVERGGSEQHSATHQPEEEMQTARSRPKEPVPAESGSQRGDTWWHSDSPTGRCQSPTNQESVATTSFGRG